MQVINLGRRAVEVTMPIRLDSSGGGYVTTSMKVGTKSAEVELIIDISKLPLYKIDRAIRAKTGKTVINGGLVVIRVKRGTEKFEPTAEPVPSKAFGGCP
jgi:hypothetical protein